MTEDSPPSAEEHRRRSAAAMFLKVHDLGADAASERPVVRLCNLMISEALLANGDELRILAPTGDGARIQLQRGGPWADIMLLPRQVQAPVINRLKVMANLDIARRPLQEGTMQVRLHDQVLSLTITVRQRGDAEEASLRLPPRTAVAESL